MAIRAAKNNVRIRFAGMDMLSLNGTLRPLKNTKERRETELKLTCPVCAVEGKPMAMNQFYLGANCGHTPSDGRPGFKTGDCNAMGKLRMEGKTPVFVAKAELDAALGGDDDEKDDKAPTIVDLTVESRPAVDAATYPAGNAYWFEPDSPTSTYTIFAELATDPNYALLGTLELRGTPGLYEIVPHRGGIVLTQLLRPSEVYSYDATKPDVKPVEADMASKLVEALANPEFDPEAYSNERTAAVRKLIEDKLAGNPVATAANERRSEKPDAEVDLTLALGAALAAVKAAKGA